MDLQPSYGRIGEVSASFLPVMRILDAVRASIFAYTCAGAIAVFAVSTNLAGS